MIKTPILLQDLRKKIYIQAKSEKTWRFWGIYVHVCKIEILRESYRLARKNNGAPGIDKMTFEDIERNGVESCFFTRYTMNLNQRLTTLYETV